jgi:phospholipase/lecithinase/hemolysin
MNMRSERRWISLCFAISLFIAPSPAVAEASFGGIVVFGTSLSDPGNAFVLTGLANTPPYDALDPLLVPDRPYARGGHHFSNGATWIEQLAMPLGLAGSVRPAFQGASRHATNYAVGGARAYDDRKNVNLSVQREAFLEDFNGSAPSDALYAIEFGANDVRDALAVFAAGGDGSSIIAGALTSVGSSIQFLYAAGARNFLVWNVPDVGLAPALRILDTQVPGVAELATLITRSYNHGLDSVLAMLEGLPGIEIKRVDVYSLLNEIAAAPSAYGMISADRACITPNLAPYACTRPGEFVFWDGLHPTTAAHGIIADLAASALAQER